MGSRRRIKVYALRAHHFANLFKDFVEFGKVPKEESFSRYTIEYIFPLGVLETPDRTCEACMPHPQINFCRGPVTRNLDRLAAEILGITIRSESRLSEEQLLDLFGRKAKEMGFEIGSSYFWPDFERAFYGPNLMKRIGWGL